MKRLVVSVFLVMSTSCYAMCFEEAAREQGLPEDILRAVAYVESRGCKNLNHQKNRDGSLDYGCMGINSSNMPTLTRFGLTEKILVTDHCANIRAGAWILAGMVGLFGPTWRAVGAYGVGIARTNAAEQARRVYAKKVFEAQNILKIRAPQ